MAAAQHRLDDDEGPAEMPFFKPDEDFLRFLTMGAAGSAATCEHLRDEFGHSAVGLERATMTNKMWATKLKRLRLPDLLCIDCGLRIEARAKTKLAIKLSESATEREGRMWDHGLRDRDLVAFLRWDEGSGASSRPRYFTVRALRQAQVAGGSVVGPPKSPREGAERDRTWRTVVPGRDGEVVEIAEDGHSVVARLENGEGRRRQTYRIDRGIPAYAYLGPGASFRSGDDFLLGVVAPPGEEDLRCSGRIWGYEEDLTAGDEIDRYIAVRVAGLRRDAAVIQPLREIADRDPSERVRLEACASLALIDPDSYMARVAAYAHGEVDGELVDPTLAMEAIFVLSEFASDDAVEALVAIARDRGCPAETRAAAVWGLGVTGAERPARVVEFIADEDDDVAMHAIVAAGSLPLDVLGVVADRLSGSDREAAAAAALLARQGEDGARALLVVVREGTSDARVWALMALGQMPRALVEAAASGRLPDEIVEALEPAWAASGRSWLPRPTVDDPLTFLGRQTICHRPPEAVVRQEGPLPPR